MRENRTYGSEGGEDGSPSLPLSPHLSFVDRRIRRSALRLLTPYGLRVTRVIAINL